MHTVKIFGERGTGFWATIIRLRSPKYSHVGAIIDDAYIYDAVLGKGVGVKPLSYDKVRRYDIVKTYQLSEAEYQEVMAEIREKSRHSYSILECVRVIAQDFNIKLKDHVNPNCVECMSELLVRLNKLPMYELYTVRPPDEFVAII